MDDLIRYDVLAQEALRGVVRRVLSDAVQEGLPGEHHFYITFRTDHPETSISQRLMERYPAEMTIVLQHQFWDLSVSPNGFEVGLAFSGVTENLLVPFDAIVGFFDPSVQFGLQFETRLESQEQMHKSSVNGSTRTGPSDMGLMGRGGDASGVAQEVNRGGSPGVENAAKVVSLDAFRKR